MNPISRRIAFLLCASLLALTHGAKSSATVIETRSFRLAYDERGITSLANPQDPFGAQMLIPGQRLGLTAKYKAGENDWNSVPLSRLESAQESSVTYISGETNSPLKVTQSFQADRSVMDWNIELEASTNIPVEIGDLSISIRSLGRGVRTPKRFSSTAF